MKSSVLLPVGLLALSLVASTKAAGDDWAAIPPDDAKIVFNGPGRFSNSQFAERSSPPATVQVGKWDNGFFYPRAEIYLRELWPQYFLSSELELKRSLAIWDFLKRGTLDLGAKEKATNVLGPVEYRRFSIKELNCVGFGQHYGASTGFDNDRGVPPHYITGYYCDDEPLSDSTVEAVVHALGVKGYKMPPAPTDTGPGPSEAGSEGGRFPEFDRL